MSAIFSDDGLCRFRLERDVQEEGIVAALIGVNPSTADATVNDATIRKDMGFARVNGWRKIIKGNVFPWRATDVRELRQVRDHRLKENARYLWRIAGDADILVPCWGDRGKLPTELRSQLDWTLKLLVRSGKPIMHFGRTLGGDFKHPLMLSYSTQLRNLE